MSKFASLLAAGLVPGLVVLSACAEAESSGGTVIGHEQASLAHLKSIPEAAIQQAKRDLQVAYGHTSHGSQLVSGMAKLDAFMGGRGLYTFNATGAGGALHLMDGAGYNERGGLVGDCGWAIDGVTGRLRFEDETRKFLGAPNGDGRGSSRPDMNVIMWSFCGQMSSFEVERQVRWYLDGMARLDKDYPGVTFVRMTGHLDGSGLAGKLHRNNEAVRAACREQGRWLYDFADIESYDPDGVEVLSKNATDGCDYAGGRNWARDWQAKHQVGRDWYQCDAAHTQPVNANRKAFAAWALFAKIAARAGR